MLKKTITIMLVVLFAGISLAADTDTNALGLQPVKQIGDKFVSEPEYWVIKSQALTELIPFLTTTRIEAQGYYKALTDYIRSTGKAQEYLTSGIKGPNSPAEYLKLIGKAEAFEKNKIKLPEKYLTWDQLVELAMVFVINEGYVPTDVNGPAEVEMFKRICETQEGYGKKVQIELRKIVQDCMDMKAYLDSINQFEACVKTARYQKEQKEIARKEEMASRKKVLVAEEQSRRAAETQKLDELRDARRSEAAEDRREVSRRNRLRTTYYGETYSGSSSNY
jgi:hypothetical protein